MKLQSKSKLVVLDTSLEIVGEYETFREALEAKQKGFEGLKVNDAQLYERKNGEYEEACFTE